MAVILNRNTAEIGNGYVACCIAVVTTASAKKSFLSSYARRGRLTLLQSRLVQGDLAVVGGEMNQWTAGPNIRFNPSRSQLAADGNWEV